MCRPRPRSSSTKTPLPLLPRLPPPPPLPPPPSPSRSPNEPAPNDERRGAYLGLTILLRMAGLPLLSPLRGLVAVCGFARDQAARAAAALASHYLSATLPPSPPSPRLARAVVGALEGYRDRGLPGISPRLDYRRCGVCMRWMSVCLRERGRERERERAATAVSPWADSDRSDGSIARRNNGSLDSRTNPRVAEGGGRCAPSWFAWRRLFSSLGNVSPSLRNNMCVPRDVTRHAAASQLTHGWCFRYPTLRSVVLWWDDFLDGNGKFLMVMWDAPVALRDFFFPARDEEHERPEVWLVCRVPKGVLNIFHARGQAPMSYRLMCLWRCQRGSSRSSCRLVFFSFFSILKKHSKKERASQVSTATMCCAPTAPRTTKKTWHHRHDTHAPRQK